jgi:tetratricopeptide (TPR) repeat protein
VSGPACLVALFFYGCFYPFLNPVWTVWRRLERGIADGAIEMADVRRLAEESQSPQVFRRAIARLLENGQTIEGRGRAAEEQGDADEARSLYQTAEARYKEAVRIWEVLEIGTAEGRAVKRLLGLPLFEELMGTGADHLAKKVLAGLVEMARVELARKTPEDSESILARADSLNDLAWFLALQGENLPEALLSAREAVKIVRHAPYEGFPPFSDPVRRRAESAYLNTLGWVQFLLAEETDQALKNLRDAAELAPLGANFLYLGLAYASLGDERAAVEAVRSAEKAGGLTAYEKRLFREVKADLGM